MTLGRVGPWEVGIKAWTGSKNGRRIWVTALLLNQGVIRAAPDPRRLKPTLRCLSNQALAFSDIFTADEDLATIYRLAVQPGHQVCVRFFFDGLPPDRMPAHLVVGDGPGACFWSAPDPIPTGAAPRRPYRTGRKSQAAPALTAGGETRSAS